MPEAHWPVLLNISGPYAVGKDTILDWVIARYGNHVHRVRTLTTRPSTPEADPYYTTVGWEELRERTSVGNWLVNYQIDGTVGYATSLDEIWEQGRTKLCLHSIYAGPQGAGALREAFGPALISIGLLPGRGTIDQMWGELVRRMVARGRDNRETIERRMMSQHEPLGYVLDNVSVPIEKGHMSVFDTVIINDDLEKAKSEVDGIIQTLMEERSRGYEER